jgi:hypothetical protein
MSAGNADFHPTFLAISLLLAPPSLISGGYMKIQIQVHALGQRVIIIQKNSAYWDLELFFFPN